MKYYRPFPNNLFFFLFFLLFFLTYSTTLVSGIEVLVTSSSNCRDAFETINNLPEEDNSSNTITITTNVVCTGSQLSMVKPFILRSTPGSSFSITFEFTVAINTINYIQY